MHDEIQYLLYRKYEDKEKLDVLHDLLSMRPIIYGLLKLIKKNLSY